MFPFVSVTLIISITLVSDKVIFLNLDGAPISNVFVFVSPDIALITLVSFQSVTTPVSAFVELTVGSMGFFIEPLSVKSTSSNVSKIIVESVAAVTLTPLSNIDASP